MFQHSKGTPSVSFPYTKIAVAALVVIAAFALGMIFGQNRAKQPITLEDGQVIGIGELRCGTINTGHEHGHNEQQEC